jgi:hypothetical protein
MNPNIKVSKLSNVSIELYCKCCDYKCSKKQNYNKHLSTARHKKMEILTKPNDILTNPNEKVSNVSKYPIFDMRPYTITNI